MSPIFTPKNGCFAPCALPQSRGATVARRVAEDLMHDQVKMLLGAERGRLELPIAAARQVDAVQRDIRTRAGVPPLRYARQSRTQERA